MRCFVDIQTEYMQLGQQHIQGDKTIVKLK